MSRKRVVISCASMLAGVLMLMWACEEKENAPTPPPINSVEQSGGRLTGDLYRSSEFRIGSGTEIGRRCGTG